MSAGIEVAYNNALKPLERVLARVRRPGDYFVQGSLETPLPRVDVEGVGVLSFPVPQPQIEALIALSERAPYGLGPETVLDTSVRKVWQLAPAKLRVGGKAWPKTLERIVSAVAEGLGCARAEVSAELYKLLVYDQGAFFKPHRDTEKADGMFGTLLIVLPSPHAGGEVVVRHAGRETIIDLSGGDIDELHFAAFYADCEHEVQPVTHGNRICLVYSLLQPPSKGRRRSRPIAPIYDAEVAETAALLEKAFARSDAATKIAWLLEHQYSPAGLSFAALKNADRALAKVLKDAASRTDCAIHLGIVHIEEYGAAEITDYRHWGGYDDEEIDASDDEYEVVEVSDGWSHVDNWLTPDDRAADLGSLPLREGEILPSGALDGEPPDENRLLEASGNEGVSFERSYHRAVLVIWPHRRFVDVLLQGGVGASLPYLEARAAAPAAEAQPSDLLAEARRVVEAWERQPDRAVDDVVVLDSADEDSDEDSDDDFVDGAETGPVGATDRSRMIAVLQRIGDAALLERFISGVVAVRFEGGDASALADAAQVLGAKRCAALFSEFVSRRAQRAARGCLDLVARLVDAQTSPIAADWKAALRQIAAALVDALPTVTYRARGAEAGSGAGTPREVHRPDGATLARFLKVLGPLDAPELRSSAYAAVAANSNAFDPRSVVVPALQLLRDGGTTLIGDVENERLWRHAADQLLVRSEYPPPSPRDWRQDVKLSCACADCRQLARFTADPVEQIHRFRVRKDRRQHLHREIERHGLDMSHVTERSGSPQTLVCTKTRRSYARRCEEHRRDVAVLGVLADLVQEPASAVASRRARIAAARERAEELGSNDRGGVKRAERES